MFVKRDIRGEDAIRLALKGGGWMSKDALARATGFSPRLVYRRAHQMSVRGELHERRVDYPLGGSFKEYSLLVHGETQDRVAVWKPRELDEALGGITFPQHAKHPAPSVRHRLFF